MKKWKSNLFPVITLAVCLGLAACGGGRKPLEITVVNRTTYPVEDIRIRETDGKDWGENRLETTLAQGESIKIDLGKYTVCLLYTSPSPRDGLLSRMPSSA